MQVLVHINSKDGPSSDSFDINWQNGQQPEEKQYYFSYFSSGPLSPGNLNKLFTNGTLYTYLSVVFHEVHVKRGENSKLPHQNVVPLLWAHLFSAILEVYCYFVSLWKAIWGWAHTLPWWSSFGCLEDSLENTRLQATPSILLHWDFQTHLWPNSGKAEKGDKS